MRIDVCTNGIRLPHEAAPFSLLSLEDLHDLQYARYAPWMFEVTGDHIDRLGDADLRTLVVRLALAELAAQGLPRSSVTAGGHQDAKDGGIDVRVEVSANMPSPDFVPRAVTGFQVKRPDMPASEIAKEMRPEPTNTLRPSIEHLAERSGAYIIVSAQGSVADKPLENRRTAIRNALRDCPNREKLHTDFYDRERLANWTNLYPGAAAWVSKHFIALLRNAPNKASFLGDVYSRIHPDGWSGPLSAVLEQRRTKLAELADLGDKEIDAWLAVANTFIDNWIMRERCKESGQEESFE